MKLLIIFIVINLCNASTVFGAELEVRHVRPESATDQRHEYYISMLRLALEKTKDIDGEFRLVASKTHMFQSRGLEQLKKNKSVDIIWTMTSKKREAELLPIRIPLLKGLLGHRIFIIRKGEESRFLRINTLAELKQLTAGQGSDWPDTQILKTNGIKVVSSVNYDDLFEMLKYKRFDYFPRGVNEPWAEVKAHQNSKLMVEKTLLLHYPAPIYFFVNKENANLAHRLERGLRIALKDGSFEQVFRHHPANREVFDLANIKTRKIFKLHNPLLP
ncbi:hypothetical protein A9Q77_02035, partial [Marinomonas sp. 42_23_T18]